jgi:replication factor C small subunit
MILISSIGVDESDLMVINASDENSVDVMRDKIKNFAMSAPLGEYKVVLLDEADYLSNSSQAVLRKLMEDCYDTTRFIIIGNYEHKIIEAIRSRCTFKWRFSHPSERAVLTRMELILRQELVQYTTDDLISVIADTYPDIRSCIGRLQQLTNNGVLSPSALLHHDGLTKCIERSIQTSTQLLNLLINPSKKKPY